MFALGAFIFAYSPRDAAACTLPPCNRPYIGSSLSIPANAGGVWAKPGRAWFDGIPQGFDDLLVLRMSAEEGFVELDVEQIERSIPGERRLALRPITPLIEGETLVLEVLASPADEACGWDEPTELGTHLLAAKQIGPPAEKPTSLGVLEVALDPNGEGRAPGGSGCYYDFPASSARFTLIPDEKAEPWLGVVVYETVVDGEVYGAMVHSWSYAPPFGGSWLGRGVDDIFTACPPVEWSHSGVSPGKHTVLMRAVFPDGSTVETPPVTVVLRCPGIGCSASPSSNTTLALLFILASAALSVWRRRLRRLASR